MRQAFIIGIVLLIGFAAVSSSFSAPSGTNIVLGRRQVHISSSPVTIDGNLYVPLDVVTALGADYVSQQNGRKVTVTRADGQSSDLAATLHGGRVFLPLTELARALGTAPDWQAGSQTLRMIPLISGIEYTEGRLVIRSDQPVQFSGRLFDALKVFVVDVSPAKLDSKIKEVVIGEGDAIRARLGQFAPETVRVAIDLKRPVSFAPSMAKSINAIIVPIAPKPAKPKPVVQTSKPAVASTPKPVSAVPATPAASAGPILVSGVKFEPGEQDKCKLVITANGRAATRPFVLKNPDRLVIDVMGAKLDDGAAQDITVAHPTVKAIRAAQFQQNPDITRVVMDLTQRVTFSIMQADNSQIVVELGYTDQVGLKGSTVVVDPGHGGSQTGAISPDGSILEKNLNLAVAQKLVEKLQAAGASVTMTRTSDTALGLPNRPKLATDLNADIFVSLHCNSLGVPNKINGIETYYHFADPVCRRLAGCVQQSVVAETLMRDGGIKSDTVVAPNLGFSVLRNATVPAVLVEMGYLDHWADRKKLLDSTYQDKIAQGVLNGLKSFLEGEQVGSISRKTETDER